MAAPRPPDRTALLAAESATFPPKDARYRVALLYPNTYAVALSSLGYQAVWERIDALPGVACERVVLPDDREALRRSRRRLTSLETERPLTGFDVVGVSISDEMDLGALAEALHLGGLAPLVDDRPDDAPPVIVGGPLTHSNPRPLAAFADAVVCGDSEAVLAPLVRAALDAPGRAAFREAAAALPSVYVGERHGDDPPPAAACGEDHLPAAARIWTPHAALADMFLVEVSRGCPRRCAFCLSRRSLRPERRASVDRVWDRIPADAPRVGFVGSAVSDHPGLVTLLERAVERGQGVGVSSLRADRLDDALVDVLVRGGAKTITVAADALSERLRNAIHKGVREDDILRAAELARAHGVSALKLYTIVGLPDETDADVDEWVALCDRLRRTTRLTLSVNPFVPKLGTPLATAAIAPRAVLDRRLAAIRRALEPKGVEVRSLSPRWAWVQWRLSQGGRDAGRAAWEAARAGGRFADWKRALGDR